MGTFFWKLIKPLLFLIPAEVAHDWSKPWIRWIGKLFPMPRSIEKPRIGLAAGFDKNADLLEVLPRWGFDFVEIGTVTPRPQGGNPEPRLFRDVKSGRLFNRMGFNNLGAGVISERVKKAKPKLPPGFQVGINIGKNKNTPDAEAHLDYAKVARAFLDTADFFVINVSSPNTPGLRALQSIEALTPIIQGVQNEVASPANFQNRKIPIWVKLAPELQKTDLTVLCRGIQDLGIQGIVLTNTEAGTYIYRGETYSGGWSGKNLTDPSRSRLTEAISAVRKIQSFEWVSVGGIDSAQEAQRRLDLGATRIEFYTGWVFEGPGFPRQLQRQLRK